jgi:hypothetical protein
VRQLTGHRELAVTVVTVDGRRVPVRFADLPAADADVSLLGILRVIGLGLIALIVRDRRESGGKRRGSP